MEYIPKNIKKEEKLHVRCSKTEKSEIESWADNEKISVSELVRKSVNFYHKFSKE